MRDFENKEKKLLQRDII